MSDPSQRWLNPESHRAFKEMCIAIHRGSNPSIVSRPWYCSVLPTGCDDWVPVIRDLHTVAVPPWPSDDAVMITELPGVVSMFYGFSHTSDHEFWPQVPSGLRIMPGDCGEGVHSGLVLQGMVENGNVVITERMFGLKRIIVSRSKIEEMIAGVDGVGPLVDVIASTYTVGEPGWFAFKRGLKDGLPDSKWRASFHFATAWNMLIGLANTIAPCHYKVGVTMRGTFGTKGCRKAFAGKRITAYIPYERLYGMAGSNPAYKVSPHRVRQHYKNQWKAAGIDRFQLPDDPAERVAIATANKVKKVLCPAHWTGPRFLEDQDFGYEINVDE